MPRRPDLLVTPSAPPDLPPVYRAGDHPPSVIEQNVRSGRWTRVSRGLYVTSPEPRLSTFARAEHLELATLAAARARLTTDHVLSHTSAARMWGLPVPASRRPQAHVTQRWSAGGRMSPSVRRHVVELTDDEVTDRAGHPVTTLERTAVDCALMLDASAALVLVDAALHQGASRDLCGELLARRRGARGVRTARAVLSAADDGAESPGESRARLALIRLGIAPPQTQVRVQTDIGVFWCDLGWDEWLVLAEYDGIGKYTSRGEAAHEVLREKRRQEAIEDTGRRVLRITKDDLANPALLERRARRYLPPTAFGHRVDPYLR